VPSLIFSEFVVRPNGQGQGRRERGAEPMQNFADKEGGQFFSTLCRCLFGIRDSHIAA